MLTAVYVRESTQPQEVPPDVRAALAQSRLGRGLMAARGTFLTGLTTYLLKLGPENLPEHRFMARASGSRTRHTTGLNQASCGVI